MCGEERQTENEFGCLAAGDRVTHVFVNSTNHFLPPGIFWISREIRRKDSEIWCHSHIWFVVATILKAMDLNNYFLPFALHLLENDNLQCNCLVLLLTTDGANKRELQSFIYNAAKVMEVRSLDFRKRCPLWMIVQWLKEFVLDQSTLTLVPRRAVWRGNILVRLFYLYYSLSIGSSTFHNLLDYGKGSTFGWSSVKNKARIRLLNRLN